MWRGDLMRKYRAEKGMTQKETAEILEVTEAAVSRWETNTMNPSPLSARKIAELLNVEVEELYLEEFTPDQLKRMKAIPILNTNDETFVPVAFDVKAAIVTDHDFCPWYRQGDILYISNENPNDGDLAVIVNEKGERVPGVVNHRQLAAINGVSFNRIVDIVGKVSHILERIGR